MKGYRLLEVRSQAGPRVPRAKAEDPPPLIAKYANFNIKRKKGDREEGEKREDDIAINGDSKN